MRITSGTWRILLFTSNGLGLDVLARNSLERDSYARLAKSNLKPIVRGFRHSKGAVVVIDLEALTTQTTWSKLGPDREIATTIKRWFAQHTGKTLLSDWKAKNP